MRSASALPAPNTTFVRVSASGQSWQSLISLKRATSCSRRPTASTAHELRPAVRREEAARSGALFAGAGCAIAGSTPEAVAVAEALARSLGMNPFEIDDAGRAAYHAAASLASNFLVTLQAAAKKIATKAGLT